MPRYRPRTGRPRPRAAIPSPGEITRRSGKSGPVGYLLAIAGGLGKPLVLAGPVTGSVRWRPLPAPCAGGDSGAVAAASGWLFLGCGSEPSAGNQLKNASWDRGGSWHVTPSLAPTAGVANAGFPLLATTVTSTFGVVIQQGVYTRQVWLTRDGGSHWTPVTTRAIGVRRPVRAGQAATQRRT
jgi:hypothetical protein